MRAILNTLFAHQSLSRETAREVLVNIASAKYNSSQVAAFMSVYLMRPITVEELGGFRDAMLGLCRKVDLGIEVLDIVGTGGDGKDTFNISTLACFVAAGAGIKVAKHGNYGVSSVSGSSNVLEAIGYKFSGDTAVLKHQLEEAGLCFMHAPLFHPAMKNVAPIRKELGVRTFFNMLGPVVNPCFPKYKVLGVYHLEMARLYHYLLQPTSDDYMIVHSLDGYDEVSLTGEFKIISREREYLLDPAGIGLQRLEAGALYGGATVREAAKTFMSVLKGEGSKAQSEAVAVNAALAIHCVNRETDLKECIGLAKDALCSGRAFNVYKKLIGNGYS